MITAVATTLAIPELLETILLNLPLTYILLAQRVCKAWRNLIRDSKAIQQSLFLAPVVGSPSSIDRYSNIGWIFRQGRPFDADGKPLVHPLIQWRFMSNQGEAGTRHDGFVTTNPGPEIMKLPHESQASWRSMSLLHPPLHNVNLYSTLGSSRLRTHPRYDIENGSESGVTVGGYVDGLRDYWKVFFNLSTTMESVRGIDEIDEWPRRWHFAGDSMTQSMSIDSTGYQVLAKMAELS
ncbi:hypothetical protein LTR62_008203 [Meristemomyces frigidus]|uniref:F-box domain-containing protein n=1 Tax=Meristemomyces frigidus TaxID=1508187 RepID=A0AAN7YNF3_9PEZI|nr:hypothetical protein LTR62_008203 [Meristemomyces frigidus]